VGGTGTGIGSGKGNTERIVAEFGDAEPDEKKTDYAAKLCSDLVYGGFSDWFLPSMEELNLMYVNLHKKGLGGFSGFYWSSSEYGDGSSSAFSQSFGSGGRGANARYSVPQVRPVRAF